MKLFSRLLITISLFIFSIWQVSAEDAGNILATNSWTAAIVKMAGADAGQLAPNSMEHPPEYELKPSDINKIRNAELLVYAGYEVLMQTVFESFGKPEEQMLKITTSYAPDVLEKSVTAIAERTGTLAAANRNIEAYRRQIGIIRQQLKDSGIFGSSAVVNFHQRPLAAALGFEIIGVYGPQPLSAGQIAELGKLKPEILIDNIHNPMAGPLEEIYGRDAVVLMNFPGQAGTESVADVLEYNGSELLHYRN